MEDPQSWTCKFKVVIIDLLGNRRGEIKVGAGCKKQSSPKLSAELD